MRRCAAVVMVGILAALSVPAALQSDQPVYSKDFWQWWSDGRGELTGYDLTFPRYGELRHGVAVTIFVTEPFSKSLRVKADPGKHPPSDVVEVMKLNLVRDFPTGIYDYNIMTSVFVALQPSEGLPAGAPVKVSFSSQEWCGHVYDQLLFRDTTIDRTSHSYFDGEADKEEKLSYPKSGLTEDALLLWARGLAEPRLAPGETRRADVLLSLSTARLKHQPLSWRPATLTHVSGTETVRVPGGSFEASVHKVDIQGGASWNIYVEKNEPHRVVKWTTSDGEKGELLASERLAYWEMNGAAFRSAVKKLGLSERPPRTP